MWLFYSIQELRRDRILVVHGIVKVHQFRMLLVQIIVHEEEELENKTAHSNKQYIQTMEFSTNLQKSQLKFNAVAFCSVNLGYTRYIMSRIGSQVKYFRQTTSKLTTDARNLVLQATN
jgi:hypothetical protein